MGYKYKFVEKLKKTPQHWGIKFAFYGKEVMKKLRMILWKVEGLAFSGGGGTLKKFG